MRLRVFEDRTSLGQAAALQAATAIRAALSQRDAARIVAATAASQREFLEALVQMPDIAWRKVEVFHLDEYVGLAATHPGSFRGMLLDQLIRKTGVVHYHLLEGDAADPAAVARRVGRELVSGPIDIAFLGIGENGHIAFNDPPADFTTEEPYIVVELDEACRRQQVGEAWFADLEQVPRQALSMSVRQIMKIPEVLAVVPDSRKAEAVRRCLEGPIDPMAPASVLRRHANATVYLDRASASLLSQPLLGRIGSEGTVTEIGP